MSMSNIEFLSSGFWIRTPPPIEAPQMLASTQFEAAEPILPSQGSSSEADFTSDKVSEPYDIEDLFIGNEETTLPSSDDTDDTASDESSELDEIQS